MNKDLLDKATIRLLKILGGYTQSVEVNDAIHTMTLAGVRIQRLQNEIDQDGWISTEDEMPDEDDGKVLMLFGDPFFGEFVPEIECGYREEGEWRFWLNKVVNTNGVTHWQPLPTEEPDTRTVDDGWVKVEDAGLPIEGRWYDTFTWTREGHRTVRELFYDGENDYGIHWLDDGDWLYPVTHWKERTDPPINE